MYVYIYMYIYIEHCYSHEDGGHAVVVVGVDGDALLGAGCVPPKKENS